MADIEVLECLLDSCYPGLFPAVEAGLSLVATKALAGRTKPRALIYESVSGYGKSAVVQMFFPSSPEGFGTYAHRCDKFTPKSFVSHAASVHRDRLRQVDLLPQLEGKVLLTKELAPIFRGREDELKENFAILIPVLDGQGFTSHSGVQGKRGYERRILFNWLGATTPLPRETHRLMYQLGTRLLFFEIPSVPPDEDKLLDYASSEGASSAEQRCQEAVNEFLVRFFEQHPPNSVAPEDILIPRELLREAVKWAQLLACVRAGIKYEKTRKTWKPVAANTPEGPYKVIDAFKEFVRARALIYGRDAVASEDLELIAHIAISSIPAHLRGIVRQLRQTDTVTSPEVQALCAVTRPTARIYLEELALLRIVNLSKGSPRSNTPDRAVLEKEFLWLLHRQP